MWHVFGIGVKVDRGVGEWMWPSLFFSPWQYMREVSLAPRSVYHWEKIPFYISWVFSWSHSGLWDCRHSQAARHTCWECLPLQDLFTWSVQEFHFAPLQLHILLWQHSLDVSVATLVVLWLSCTCSWFYALNLIALLLIVDVRLWGSVQFLAQARARPLFTCL